MPSLRSRSLSIAVSLLGCVLLFLSVQPPAAARAAPTGNVCGAIATNTTWLAANNPYTVTCDVQVTIGVTLTIESGVVVKFGAGTSLQVDGTLIAQGATFTSGKPTHAKGDWGRIFFTASSVDAVFNGSGQYIGGSLLQNSLVEWGGGGAGVSGAVEAASASPFITANTIQNNASSGLHATGRSASHLIVVSGNNLNHNTVNGDGGGLYVANGSVTGNTVDSNVTAFVNGDRGGGIYASASTLLSNTVTNNNSYTDGGGIYATGSTLIGNVVSGNNADGYHGGGVYASGSTLTGNTVSGNTVNQYGAGIYAAGGTVTNNTISGNFTTGAYGNHVYGGGIYASLSTVNGNLISGNSAAGLNNDNAYGGGIYGSGSTITGNTITGNTASTVGANNVGYGGGIYADGGAVSSNVVHLNTASGGADGQGGGIYGRQNTVQQNTVTNNSSQRGGGVYSFKGTTTNNTILSNTTTLSGTLYVDEGTALQNTLKYNTANYGGGLYGYKATLTGNTLEANTANVGAGLYAISGTVRANLVQSNTAQSDGGGLYANGSIVTQNFLAYNQSPSFGYGSGAYVVNATDFSYNSVVSNTAPGGVVGGVSISGQPQVHYNNLYGNLPYDAEVVSSGEVSATLNYWGPSACGAIPGQFYDGLDAPGRGPLRYAPSLYSPTPLAQLSAPANLSVVTGTATITLTWTPSSPVPDIGCRNPGPAAPDWGYRLYYDADSCTPYNGSGLPQGDSPIDLGQGATVVVNGLSASGDYHFVVAAYDYLGRESAYSNEVVKLGEQRRVYLPVVLKNG
ncbi:MAG: hypothetical protein HY870_01745 [Chloroflexi bacterium]|nr:hypothetical protein [Chloroflexota bacterium]